LFTERGDYPVVMREMMGDKLPTFSEEEKKWLRNSCEFFSLNYYSSRYIAARRFFLYFKSIL